MSVGVLVYGVIFLACFENLPSSPNSEMPPAASKGHVTHVAMGLLVVLLGFVFCTDSFFPLWFLAHSHAFRGTKMGVIGRCPVCKEIQIIVSKQLVSSYHLLPLCAHPGA